MQSVNTCEEAIKVIEKGLKGRRVAAHSLNDVSSRSHIITVFGLQNGGRFVVVDLCGSEDWRKMEVPFGTSPEQAKRMACEATAINQSLSHLKTVLTKLSKGERSTFRDHPILHRIRPYFNRESRVSLIACVRHGNSNEGLTKSTLDFASMTSEIVLQQAQPGRLYGLQTQALSPHDELIRQLRQQIALVEQKYENCLQQHLCSRCQGARSDDQQLDHQPQHQFESQCTGTDQQGVHAEVLHAIDTGDLEVQERIRAKYEAELETLRKQMEKWKLMVERLQREQQPLPESQQQLLLLSTRMQDAWSQQETALRQGIDVLSAVERNDADVDDRVASLMAEKEDLEYQNENLHDQKDELQKAVAAFLAVFNETSFEGASKLTMEDILATLPQPRVPNKHQPGGPPRVGVVHYPASPPPTSFPQFSGPKMLVNVRQITDQHREEYVKAKKQLETAERETQLAYKKVVEARRFISGLDIEKVMDPELKDMEQRLQAQLSGIHARIEQREASERCPNCTNIESQLQKKLRELRPQYEDPGQMDNNSDALLESMVQRLTREFRTTVLDVSPNDVVCHDVPHDDIPWKLFFTDLQNQSYFMVSTQQNSELQELTEKLQNDMQSAIDNIERHTATTKRGIDTLHQRYVDWTNKERAYLYARVEHEYYSTLFHNPKRTPASVIKKLTQDLKRETSAFRRRVPNAISWNDLKDVVDARVDAETSRYALLPKKEVFSKIDNILDCEKNIGSMRMMEHVRDMYAKQVVQLGESVKLLQTQEVELLDVVRCRATDSDNALNNVTHHCKTILDLARRNTATRRHCVMLDNQIKHLEIQGKKFEQEARELSYKVDDAAATLKEKTQHRRACIADGSNFVQEIVSSHQKISHLRNEILDTDKRLEAHREYLKCLETEKQRITVLVRNLELELSTVTSEEVSIERQCTDLVEDKSLQEGRILALLEEKLNAAKASNFTLTNTVNAQQDEIRRLTSTVNSQEETVRILTSRFDNYVCTGCHMKDRQFNEEREMWKAKMKDVVAHCEQREREIQAKHQHLGNAARVILEQRLPPGAMPPPPPPPPHNPKQQ
eukprot:PhF_6_TR8005/c1_g1_i9/m.12385